MPSRCPVPFQVVECATTAERVAFTFEGNDIGRTIVRDHETGGVYDVVASGSGIATMSARGRSLRYVDISLNDLRECDANNDVANIAGNGGLLASDTTPILRGRATTNNLELSWAATNVDPVLFEHGFGSDFDGAQDVFIELIVNSGTTDVATMGIATTWDGGTEVADSATDAAASATDHAIVGTIAAADVPNSAKHVTVRLTPPTHGTNAIQLSGIRLYYYAK
jgi:hypothetical protein